MQTLFHSLEHDPRLWIQPAVVFAVTLGIVYLLRRIFFRALRAWADHGHSRYGLIIVRTLRWPTHIWNLILALHFAIQSSALPPRITAHAPELLEVLFIVSLTVMFMRMAGGFVRHFGGQAPGALPVTSLTQNLAQLAVLVFGILLLMRRIGLDITPILTALGVGGLAVALALQDTLSNLFGGFWLSIAGQVRLGDYIKLNSGEEGYVTDISWRCTAIRAGANNMIIVPNAKLAQAIVTNYYLPDKRMATSVQVNVSYDSDLYRVEHALLEIAQKGASEIAGMVAEPAPSVMLDPGFGDSAINFTLNFHVAEFSNQAAVKHELRKRIIVKLRQESIEIPFPTRTVRMEGEALASRDGRAPFRSLKRGPRGFQS